MARPKICQERTFRPEIALNPELNAKVRNVAEDKSIPIKQAYGELIALGLKQLAVI